MEKHTTVPVYDLGDFVIIPKFKFVELVGAIKTKSNQINFTTVSLVNQPTDPYHLFFSEEIVIDQMTIDLPRAKE